MQKLSVRVPELMTEKSAAYVSKINFNFYYRSLGPLRIYRRPTRTVHTIDCLIQKLHNARWILNIVTNSTPPNVIVKDTDLIYVLCVVVPCRFLDRHQWIEGNVCLSLQDKSNYFNMKMEAADTPEQFVPIYQNSWRQITGHRDWKWYVQDDAKSKFILELRIHKYLLMGRVLSANLPTLSFTKMKYRYCNLVCSNGGIILRGENRWT